MDIVKRLREQNRMNWDAFQKAATEIERLREVLREIADADAYDENGKPNGGGYFINLARATLLGDKE